MIRMDMDSPFKAPVYFILETHSTMDEARRAAQDPDKAPHGSLICTDHQTSGRGRIHSRIWEDKTGESLLCTCILRKHSLEQLPQNPSLMAGIAVLRAVEGCYPELSGRCAIKWPNDLIADGRKICGILCEADRNCIYIGIGLNVLQETFPAELSAKASSLALLLKNSTVPDRVFLLTRLLQELFLLFGDTDTKPGTKPNSWHKELEERLYCKSKQVRFISGIPADCQEKQGSSQPHVVQGILAGIGEDGSLLIQDEASGTIKAFISGELDVYS